MWTLKTNVIKMTLIVQNNKLILNKYKLDSGGLEL